MEQGVGEGFGDVRYFPVENYLNSYVCSFHYSTFSLLLCLYNKCAHSLIYEPSYKHW